MHGKETVATLLHMYMRVHAASRSPGGPFSAGMMDIDGILVPMRKVNLEICFPRTFSLTFFFS